MSGQVYIPCAGLDLQTVIAAGGADARRVADLYRDVHALASRLPAGTEHGATRSTVLIACADRYLFAVALLASWERGHAAALPPGHRPKTIEELAAADGVVAVVHDGEVEGAGLDVRDVVERAATAAGSESDAVTGMGLAAIPGAAHVVTLYTSGSTGEPEAVVKRASQLLGEAEVLDQCFGADLQRVLCTLPARHIYGLLFGLLLPLRAGAAFLRETPLHADAIRELIQRHAVDTLVAVPAHLQGLEGADELPAVLRRVFSSGAPLRAETFAALGQRHQLRVVEVLGSTETGGIGHRAAAGDPFTPFPGVVVRAGENDELLLQSPRLAPELPQPHACEDRIELLPGGAFAHLGRADDVVKVGGTRVSLAAIERKVRGLPGITDAALLAREIPGARGQEILLAAAGSGWDAGRMRAALAAWFEPVVLPRRYRFVSELPREATGKLRRDALLALFEARDPASLLEWSAREHDGNRLRAQVRIPAELLYFRGHFAEWPVLPGVAQLGLLAVREALATWPELGVLRGVRRLKFKRPVEPDHVLALELVRQNDARVDFSLEHAGELCSSGSLFFAPREGA